MEPGHPNLYLSFLLFIRMIKAIAFGDFPMFQCTQAIPVGKYKRIRNVTFIYIYLHQLPVRGYYCRGFKPSCDYALWVCLNLQYIARHYIVSLLLISFVSVTDTMPCFHYNHLQHQRRSSSFGHRIGLNQSHHIA